MSNAGYREPQGSAPTEPTPKYWVVYHGKLYTTPHGRALDAIREFSSMENAVSNVESRVRGGASESDFYIFYGYMARPHVKVETIVTTTLVNAS